MTQIVDFLDPNGASGIAPQLRETAYNPGELRMLNYAPHHLPLGAPLVVTLHGCGQSADAFAVGAGWLTLADRHGFALLCPEQKRANNPNTCFNWFQPDDARRDGGEAHSIAQMTRLMLENHALDPARVFIAGLSAGGAMTNVMLATYPELYAAGAVIAGLPYAAARSLHEALVAMRRGAMRAPETLAEAVRDASPHRGPWPKISIWHGDSDSTVAPANAGHIVRQWADVHRVSTAPPALEEFGARQRTRWRDARGDIVVELNVIAGLSHGWALAAAGADGCGAPGPFLPEAGISTSAEILRFWGIHAEQARAASERVEIVELVRPPSLTTKSEPRRLWLEPPDAMTPPEGYLQGQQETPAPTAKKSMRSALASFGRALSGAIRRVFA